MFQEIHYWERLMFEIPHYAADVYTKREDLRNLREHVLLVVRDYNRYCCFWHSISLWVPLGCNTRILNINVNIDILSLFEGDGKLNGSIILQN